MYKVSIRFFNDRKVRAVWDEEHCKWWFSATDIVRAINNEDDYAKSRNYWKYLKGKFVKEGIQLVSATNQFKFEAPDGKMRKADVLDAENVQLLAKHYPNNRANDFLDWFVYSDNSLDGQSKKKAYTLIESGLLDSMEPGSVISMPDKMTQIERIRHMEQLYDLATEAMKEQPMSASTHAKAQEAMAKLAAYYGSDEWKQDFADDEAGLLPKDLKRGVLSEDGLWNLLSEER